MRHSSAGRAADGRRGDGTGTGAARSGRADRAQRDRAQRDGAMSRAGWRLLTGQLARRRVALARLAGWSVLEVVPVAGSGLLLARAVDTGFLRGDVGTGTAWLGALAIAMVIGAYGAKRTFGALADVVEPLRDELVTLVVTGAVGRAASGTGGPDTGSVSRLTAQTEAVRQMTGSLLVALRQFAFTAAATIAGLTVLLPLISLLVLPPVLLALVLFWFLLLGVAPRAQAALVAAERTAAALGTVTAGMPDIVACRAQPEVTAATGAVIGAQAAAERALARMSARRMLVIACGTQVPLLVVLVAAPWLVRSGLATAGEVVGAVTYVTASLAPAMHMLVQGVGSLGVQLGVVLHRIREAAALPAPPPAGRCRAPAGHGLEVRDLSFAYGPDADPVVHGLDLTLAPGEHLVIAGPSGIGKSTLANLLLGLLVPRSGQVRLGGVALADIDPPTLRRLTALIPQEAYVFRGSVRENLCYLRPDAADPATEDGALRRTCAALPPLARLVDRLGGLDATVSPADLDAGERQLLALGRVHLSPAAVVVLDEATSHLDPGTEAVVEESFAARPGSLVVIAHRISSARRADRVLLLDGDTVSSGAHEQLLTTSPLYADLVGLWDGTDPVAAEGSPTVPA